MTGEREPWLLIAGDFTPLGGMDRANHALAAGLARRGHPVHLVTHRAWPDLDGPGVTVTGVPRPFGSHLLGAPLLARAARVAVRSRAGARVVGNGGNVLSPDITWIHYLHAAYVAEADGRLRASMARYYRHRERQAVHAAATIVCNSRRTARDVAAAYGVGGSRLRVVYYGSDPVVFATAGDREREQAREALGWPGDRPVALFVGALGDRRKGFDRLFEAWQLLARDAGWDAILAVAGAGASLASWRARADREGLRTIRFLGFRQDIARVIAAADVMVHPARYEAYGLGVHEAICRGVPAIVSADAGIAERYDDGVRALLLQDSESAAGIAATLLEWRAAREAFRRGARVLGERLRAYSWDDMTADILRAAA